MRLYEKEYFVDYTRPSAEENITNPSQNASFLPGECKTGMITTVD
jgi:hypothetical protein